MAWFNKKKEGKVKARGFDAAAITRLTNSWTTTSNAIDWDLEKSLSALRARSRDLCMNNDYGRKFLQMCSTHVIGSTGFKPQVKVYDVKPNGVKILDNVASTAIETAFFDWALKGNCDVTGKHSFIDLCNLYIKAAARDGETLFRKVYGVGKYGFQLQALDADRLDIMLNEELSNGRRIRMGVELSSVGKPEAYYLSVRHPGDSVYTFSRGQFERVPAAEIYHNFVADRPEQNRGIPWMHASMTRLKNLGAYEEAAVIAARIGAAKMGFFTKPDGDGTPLADGTDAAGNLYTEAVPGEFGILPEGVSFETFNPDYPHAMFPEFVKQCLRGIASGIGVAYNTLANDLEGVNFSSIRTGVLEERDNWMAVQGWMIDGFLNDLFSTWLKMALLTGEIKLPNGASLPAAKFEKFNACSWQGRRWQWVDPERDINANIKAINNGLKSRTAVIAEQGKDALEVWEQLESEQETLKDKGIEIEKANPQRPATPDAPVDPNADVSNATV